MPDTTATIQLPNMFPRLGEPALELNEIQGNILAGFKKDYQDFVFYDIDDSGVFKRWLAQHVKDVATSAEVLAFNDLFKSLSSRRQDDRGKREVVGATWFNIAFSHEGLSKLANEAVLAPDAPFEEAFRAGMHNRSQASGDVDDPAGWDFGRHGAPHVMFMLASDTDDNLKKELEYLTSDLAGVRLVGIEHGRINSSDPGREHFGFKDAISQPGIYGLRSRLPTDTLTERTNPYHADTQGAPGQPLVQPGQFVFGYPYEAPADTSAPVDRSQNTDSAVNGQAETPPFADTRAPSWARNGSYVVFRKLEQNVSEFKAWLDAQYAAGRALQPGSVEAKLVGRWQSGAPVLLAPDADNPAIAADPCANNDFLYMRPGSALDVPADQQLPTEAASKNVCALNHAWHPLGDPEGRICPVNAHIRKAYPRDMGAEPTAVLYDTQNWPTQNHRMLRRGMPYEDDPKKQGLLFVSYQASIANQFEQVNTVLMGEDALLGPANRDVEVGLARPARIGHRWVTLRGGGYFFSPSIEALSKLAGGQFSRQTAGLYQASSSKPELKDIAYQLGYFLLMQLPYGPNISVDEAFYSQQKIPIDGLTQAYSVGGGLNQGPRAWVQLKLGPLQWIKCYWVPFKPTPWWQLWKVWNRATKALRVDYTYTVANQPDQKVKSSLFCYFGGPGHD